MGTLVALVPGTRTWRISLECGGEVVLASKGFKKGLPGHQGAPSAPTSTPAQQDLDADAVDEDCGADSDGEEARERLDASAPSKRALELEWEEVAISVDEREAKGIAKRRAHLIQGLEPSAEPIMSLFCRFFPLDYYVRHLAKLNLEQTGATPSRHKVKWDQ